MEYPSKWIETAVNEISKLPGIGKKSALRITLFLLKQNPEFVRGIAESLINLRENTTNCTICGNISDNRECNICTSHKRDRSIICIVEESRDVLAIENTGHFTGLYHVLGGIISPLDGIGPGELNIQELINRLEESNGEVREIIFALSPNMEGDTTAFYISKRLKDFKVKISSIARGIPIGGDLEYADEITLGRSIQRRVNYNEE